jgi:hypothetical protein
MGSVGASTTQDGTDALASVCDSYTQLVFHVEEVVMLKSGARNM